jgi:cardiolipin synthase
MTRALRDATRRGVDLRVIVPGRSDVEIVRHASRAVWGRLLGAGARIYEWQPSILHSKTAVVDSEWATIGSFNLDYRSLRNNLELNVSVLDPVFAKTVEDSFRADMKQCIEVDRRAFMFRSLGDRLLERVAYWFRAWL